MKQRRGSGLWGETDGLASMIYRFEPGDIVIPVAVQQSDFIGVVKEVLPKINKIMVLWGGGSLKQHDPDEIMLHPHQDSIVRTRMATSRRMRAENPIPSGDQFVGDPETHGINEPRGGGFSIMQDLQKDLHQEMKKESDVEVNPRVGSRRGKASFFVDEGKSASDLSLKSVRTGAEVTKQEWKDALDEDEAMLEKYQKSLAKLEKGEEVENLTIENAKKAVEGLKEVIKNKKTLMTKLASLRSRRGMDIKTAGDSVPHSLGQWNVYAGGTGVEEGYNSYDTEVGNIRTGGRKYSISPVSNNSGYFQGYFLSVFPGRNHGHSGIDAKGEEVMVNSRQSLFRSPIVAVRAAVAHDIAAGAPPAVIAASARGLKSRRAMYWGAPDRVYRLTKEEQEKGSVLCPRCRKEMALEPFTKSEKLYTCQKCGFKVPTSKTTTTRITIDVDKNGEVGVDVTTAKGKSRRGTLFPTEKAMRDYMREHPDADKSHHKVAPEGKKPWQTPEGKRERKQRD